MQIVVLHRLDRGRNRLFIPLAKFGGRDVPADHQRSPHDRRVSLGKLANDDLSQHLGSAGKFLVSIGCPRSFSGNGPCSLKSMIDDVDFVSSCETIRIVVSPV